MVRRFSWLAVLLTSAVAWGQVYRWVDATGEVHYTNDPSTIPTTVQAARTDGDDLGEFRAFDAGRSAPPSLPALTKRPASGFKGFDEYDEGPLRVFSDLDDAENAFVLVQVLRPLVRWFEREYSLRSPKSLELWLFQSAESFERQYLALNGHALPGLRAGMCDEKRCMANVATGEGTVAHEVAHAYLLENLRNVPPWFNGAFAQLHEGVHRSGEQALLVNGTDFRGHITYRTWEAQRTLKSDATWTLEAVMKQPAEDKGLGCSVLLFLQHRGRLKAFVRQLAERDLKADPTGYRAFLGVLGPDGKAKADGEWRTFVLGLDPKGHFTDPAADALERPAKP